MVSHLLLLKLIVYGFTHFLHQGNALIQKFHTMQKGYQIFLGDHGSSYNYVPFCLIPLFPAASHP